MIAVFLEKMLSKGKVALRFIFITMRKSVFIFFLALFIVSCGKQGAYFNPTTKTSSTAADTWEYTPSTLVTTTPTLTTFDAKHPPSLTQMIDVALHNNPQTTLSWQQAKAQAINLALARQGYYPTVTLRGFFNRIRSSPFPNDPGIVYETQYGPTLNLSWTLFDFGATYYQSRVQEKILVAMNLTHNETIQEVIQAVKNNYFDLAYEQELLKANEEDMNDALADYEVAKAKYQAGVVSFLDYVQSKAQYISSQSTYENQKTNVETSFYQLALSLGLPNLQLFKLPYFESTIDTTCTLEDANRLVTIAKNLRPDVQSYIAQAQAQKALIQQRRKERLPKLSGSFDIGRTYYDKGVHDDYNFKAQLNLSIPIFEGFGLYNNERSAKYNYEIAKTNIQEIEQQVTNEVLTLHAQLKNAAIQLEYSKEILKTQQISYEIAFEKYKQGTTSILELLTAFTNLSDSRAKVAYAKRNWYLNLTNLAKATGILTNGLISGAPLFKYDAKN